MHEIKACSGEFLIISPGKCYLLSQTTQANTTTAGAQARAAVTTTIPTATTTTSMLCKKSLDSTNFRT